MSAPWKIALSKLLSNSIIDCFENLTCRLHTQGQRASITILSNRIFTAEETMQIKSALSKMLGGIIVDIHYRYPALSQSFLQNPQSFLKLLVNQIIHEQPATTRLLSDCQLSIQNNQLIIEASPSSFTFLSQSTMASLLSHLIHDLFDIKINVQLVQNGAEESISAQIEKISKPKAEKDTQTSQRRLDPVIEGRRVVGRPVRGDAVTIKSLTQSSGYCVIKGKMIHAECKPLTKPKNKEKDYLFLADISDGTSSIRIKHYTSKQKASELQQEVGSYFAVQGMVTLDRYEGELSFLDPDLTQIEVQTIKDNAPEKRVELHLHTKMSAMDGLVDLHELFDQLKSMGHDSVAITDHGIVQAFPEAYDLAKKSGIHLIFGMEAYLIDQDATFIHGNASLDDAFIVFDIETTGLSPIQDQIIEIAAARVKNGDIVDQFSTFVKPTIPIPSHITSLTGITQEMVANAKSIDDAMIKFKDFVQNDPLVAHNALGFDMHFLRKADECFANHPVVDTLVLSRALYPGHKKYNLATLAKRLNITLTDAHRAINDVRALCGIWQKMLPQLKEAGGSLLTASRNIRIDLAHQSENHALLLVQNAKGLNNLYRLVSKSHLETFHKHPRITKAELSAHREGLFITSACEKGEVFTACLEGADDEKLFKIASFYDILEIQPDGNNEFLIRQGKLPDTTALHRINQRILSLGKKLSKPVIATGDVHFLRHEDAQYREILMQGMGFDDASEQAPLYLRTTDEMLREFSYLPRETAYEVVVQNPRNIAKICQMLRPFPEGTAYPTLKEADDELRDVAEQTCRQMYGQTPPSLVWDRLQKELSAIIENSYGTLYWIAHKLVKQSMADGYLVGSRGSVGSSFAATMAGITEVNPLPPHYLCPNCQYSQFDIDKQYRVGPDLPQENCPRCATSLLRLGYDIAFEVFLGYGGNKVPDIDLNFSGEYQSRMHKYTEVLLSEKGAEVYRAGTIGTLAERTCFGYVLKFIEEKNKTLPRAEINRLSLGLNGVKKSTGQHPGGLVVVPRGVDVFDYTPLQYPADDETRGTITTHFDFNSMKERLIKLDVLGHDYPTMIRMLCLATGVHDVPECDPGVMQLYSSVEPLGIKAEDLGTHLGTLGLPEFGTHFVRGIIDTTKPTTMDELIRINGLSHGTDVWQGNAETLIVSNGMHLRDCICNRDDILDFLQTCIDKEDAFEIMESVRKGKGLVLKSKSGTRDMEVVLHDAGVPEWFIESCKKIKYMFPKAHAAAYTIMANRIGFFKLYHPSAFYAAWMGEHLAEIDYFMIYNGLDSVKKALSELKQKGKDITDKEKKQGVVLEIALEMLLRKVVFYPVDLYASQAQTFEIMPDGIRPPFASLAGLGPSAAQSIVDARQQAPFQSVEDLMRRAKINKSSLDLLRQCGCLDALDQSNQLSLI